MAEGTLTIKNARIVTMSAAQPAASALAIEEGSIRRVGDWIDVQPVARGPVLDLDGAAVLPGFIDTHTHPSHLAWALSAVDLAGSTSLAGLLEMIRREAEMPGERDLVLAISLNPPELREARNPTRAELDAVTGRPVLIYNRGLHYACLNSAALERARFPEALSGVMRDASGAPTGQVVGHALQAAYNALVEPWLAAMDPSELVRRVAGLAASRGITTIHALDGREPANAPRQESVPALSRSAGLPRRTVHALLECDAPVDRVVYYETLDVESALDLGLPRIGGCILVDGGHEARTAAFLQPYLDNPDNSGILYFRQEELDDYVWRAHSRGLQVALHALGDAAIEQAITAYERALQRLPRADHRHRIEHFEFPTPDQVRRAARLGLALGIQPAFNHYWPHEHFLPSLGSARSAIADPIAGLMAAGILLGGGSDAPVTPLDPLLGIHTAVTHSRPEERLTTYQALRLFTSDASRLAFEEQRKGTLEEGKQADLVVLSASPLEVRPEDLRQLRVLMTIHRGRIVYQAAS